jgi:hypothetical protein
MRRVHSILSLLIVLVLAASLTGSAFAAPPAQNTKWTVMVYMSADNNLEGYAVPDFIDELAATGSSEDVQVVALMDRGPGYDTSYDDWQTTKLFHVTQGLVPSAGNAVADWGERNMGDTQTLVEFVKWAKSNFPADHYALYFWGHGWNWRPGYVMLDDTNNIPERNGTIEMNEMQAALPSLGFIDTVVFDGCNMAAVEVEQLWHGHATALSHSQEYVVWEGVQYDLVLAELAAHPDMTAEDLAAFTSQTATEDKTWSAVVVDDRFDALVKAVDDWSVALTAGLPKYRQQYKQAFTKTQSFWQASNDRDLYDMAYEINRLVPDKKIRRTSQAVMDAVDAVVLYERHVNGYTGSHGITIYHISKATEKGDLYAEYQTLDFAQLTGWDEFLDAYAQ